MLLVIVVKEFVYCSNLLIKSMIETTFNNIAKYKCRPIERDLPRNLFLSNLKVQLRYIFYYLLCMFIVRFRFWRFLLCSYSFLFALLMLSKRSQPTSNH